MLVWSSYLGFNINFKLQEYSRLHDTLLFKLYCNLKMVFNSTINKTKFMKFSRINDTHIIDIKR